jgi:hypothetical protein
MTFRKTIAAYCKNWIKPVICCGSNPELLNVKVMLHTITTLHWSVKLQHTRDFGVYIGKKRNKLILKSSNHEQVQGLITAWSVFIIKTENWMSVSLHFFWNIHAQKHGFLKLIMLWMEWRILSIILLWFHFKINSLSLLWFFCIFIKALWLHENINTV